MAATTVAPAVFYLFDATKVHSLINPTASVCLKQSSTLYRVPTLSFLRLRATNFKAASHLTASQSKLFSVLQESAVLPSQEKEEENDKHKNLKEKEEKNDGNDSPNQESTPPPEPSTKIYVGNLPFSCDVKEITEMFQQCGTVVSAELIVDKKTGRSKGYAFVTMNTVEEASKAIEKFEEFEMGARSITVNFQKIQSRRLFPNRRSRDWKQRTYVDSPHRVYVGNLAWTVNSRSLGKFFESCSNVLGAKVIYEPQSGKSHGYGFVSFLSKNDADVAIASLNGKDLEGRPVQVRMVRKWAATKKTSNGELSNGDNPANP
ncbi:hypothetical protein SUGI_0804440 [Cryptomeria japonica]|uniref:RNA-binding protein CP31B, chloroplastic n=1 Tax=Cryptomeria japonica TaxID=3369 RepID=UPI002414CFA3|nr:RNA-binding protein CP31B, chloroplastic [Cryptomeria japonica]GLJ39391.1 hypothetical protein SUGI_0804440 [Cryptomeria japonica]